MAKKKTRKELLKSDDAFLSAAQQSAEWARVHRGKVIAAAIVLVAVVVVVWGGAEYMRIRDTSASGLFEDAIQLSQAEVIVEDEETKADPTGAPPTFASEDEKNAAVLKAFNDVIAAAGSSGVGDLARLYLADLQQKMGSDEAEKTYDKLVSGLSPSDSLYFVAAERLAYLRENRGDHSGAINVLATIANREGAFFGDYATYHQARLYQAAGDTAQARTLLESVEKDYPSSSVGEAARNRLEAIGRTPAEEAAKAGDEGKAEAEAEARDVEPAKADEAPQPAGSEDEPANAPAEPAEDELEESPQPDPADGGGADQPKTQDTP